MTRFTEFLRTTATRSASNMDRMLDNLGFPHLQPTATTNQMQQYGSLNISPPQDLQPGVVVPAVPTSWSTIRGTQPLFTEAQVSQMRQAQREHPQIYGPTSDGGSDRSSRLQAEVQKQMEEYMQKHQSEIARLQREVRDLRQEKQLLLQGVPLSVPAASGIPQGNVQQLPQSGPVGVPAASGILQGNVQQLPQSGPASVPAASGIPRGNVQQLPQSGPPDVPAASNAPQGNVQQLPQSGPSDVPAASNAPRGNVQQLPQSGPSDVPAASSAPQGNVQQLPQSGPPDVPAASSAPQGNVQQLPQSGPEALDDSHLQSGFQSATGPDPGPTTSTTTGPSPQQWLGGASAQSPPDAMALLAGGMAQLQAVMLKQMSAAEKEKDGDSSPETVKPGTTTLPQLPAMKVESASVDIMDWLEMLGAPMSDLSDGSGQWWERVKGTATRSYVEWAKASPLERLKIAPPREEELESGKWSRVNSRAASMLMLALAEGVRNEMVARRLTGSASSILFRLMTLYQPGGEEEKVRILRNLQEPPQEGEPQKVLEALRSWERWLRRCRELGVTTPDPALLARGLNAMVKKMMDKFPEASFRTSLVKSTLMVDTRPTAESVDSYYRHLLAESETLAVATTSTSSPTTSTPGKPEPRIRPIRTDNATPTPPPPPLPTTRSSSQNTSGAEDVDKDKKASIPCRYFGKTFKGCARGTKCPFQHSWGMASRKKNSRDAGRVVEST